MPGSVKRRCVLTVAHGMALAAQACAARVHAIHGTNARTPRRPSPSSHRPSRASPSPTPRHRSARPPRPNAAAAEREAEQSLSIIVTCSALGAGVGNKLQKQREHGVTPASPTHTLRLLRSDRTPAREQARHARARACVRVPQTGRTLTEFKTKRLPHLGPKGAAAGDVIVRRPAQQTPRPPPSSLQIS